MLKNCESYLTYEMKGPHISDNRFDIAMTYNDDGWDSISGTTGGGSARATAWCVHPTFLVYMLY